MDLIQLISQNKHEILLIHSNSLKFDSFSNKLHQNKDLNWYIGWEFQEILQFDWDWKEKHLCRNMNESNENLIELIY